MAAKRLLLIDSRGTKYVFINNGDVIINGVNKGKGRILTDINSIALKSKVEFLLEHKPYHTLPIKAAAIKE